MDFFSNDTASVRDEAASAADSFYGGGSESSSIPVDPLDEIRNAANGLACPGDGLVHAVYRADLDVITAERAEIERQQSLVREGRELLNEKAGVSARPIGIADCIVRDTAGSTDMNHRPAFRSVAERIASLMQSSTYLLSAKAALVLGGIILILGFCTVEISALWGVLNYAFPPVAGAERAVGHQLMAALFVVILIASILLFHKGRTARLHGLGLLALVIYLVGASLVLGTSVIDTGLLGGTGTSPGGWDAPPGSIVADILGNAVAFVGGLALAAMLAASPLLSLIACHGCVRWVVATISEIGQTLNDHHLAAELSGELTQIVALEADLGSQASRNAERAAGCAYATAVKVSVTVAPAIRTAQHWLTQHAVVLAGDKSALASLPPEIAALDPAALKVRVEALQAWASVPRLQAELERPTTVPQPPSRRRS